MSAIECRHLTFSYNGKLVLDDVSITVDPGEWVALIGPNGAGKTTLLRLVAGHPGSDGSVWLEGAPIKELTNRQRAQQVAVVPQIPETPSGMPLIDYVLLGRTPFISYWGSESAADMATAHEMIATVDLLPLMDRPIGSLSGGERQRAVLARALCQESPVLLLDEPTSALDLGHQQQVLDYVDALRRERGLAVLSALHDLTLAAQYPDRLVLLDSGRVVAAGVPDEVLTVERLARHFGAEVSVMRDDAGGLVVAPRRNGTSGDGAFDE
ncbi:MAG: ABC transporter ATP-binding protein [Acidimicrobiia bacterium]|nr:ABC transporter ATP-binding protein [Acidimicrobiia bacterium]